MSLELVSCVLVIIFRSRKAELLINKFHHVGGRKHTHGDIHKCERDMLNAERPDSTQQSEQTETAETVSRMCVIAHIGGSFYTREQTRNDYCLLLFSRTESHPLALAHDTPVPGDTQLA